jgi:acetyl-CoA synthetase
MTTAMTQEIVDRVPDDAPGAKEIGFGIPERYNASDILFRNLEAGRGDKVAIHTSNGETRYRELCAEAGRIGNALSSLGLERGARILLLLNDTPAYPAAFFGAVRAGFVPMLINTLSPPDLIRFYLQDSGAQVGVVDGEYASLFDPATVADTPLRVLVSVNGATDRALPSVRVLDGDRWFAEFPSALEGAPTTRDDMAFWMYSSGSTGRPKGIVHLQHDMAYTAASFARHILDIQENDICF